MPWAKDEQISKSPLDGGIEITQEQYKDALAAVMAGGAVAVRSGELKLLNAEKRTVYSTEDGSERKIAENDDTPEGYTDTARPSKRHVFENGEWVEDEQAKAEYTNALINAERDRRIEQGATVSLASGKSFTVQMRDQRDWRNINGLGSAGMARILAGDNATTVTFRDADNGEHELTPPELVEMGLQVAAKVDAVYNASWAIKAMSPIPEDFTEDKYWQ